MLRISVLGSGDQACSFCYLDRSFLPIIVMFNSNTWAGELFVHGWD